MTFHNAAMQGVVFLLEIFPLLDTTLELSPVLLRVLVGAVLENDLRIYRGDLHAQLRLLLHDLSNTRANHVWVVT